MRSERNQKDPNVFLSPLIHTKLKLRGQIFVIIPVIIPITQRSDWDLEGLPYRVQCVFHHLCFMTDGKSNKQDISKRKNHNIGDEKQSV